MPNVDDNSIKRDQQATLAACAQPELDASLIAIVNQDHPDGNLDGLDLPQTDHFVCSLAGMAHWPYKSGCTKGH